MKHPKIYGRRTLDAERILTQRIVDSKNPHAVALGSIKSRKKALSSKKNGARGGRPKKYV